MAEKSGPYIPKAHEQYDLLPLCREEGKEVISYPAELSAIEELIREHEGAEDGTAGQKRLLMPFGYKSLEAYIDYLKGYAEKYRAEDPELVSAIKWLVSAVRRMNVKEDWSIVRYVGHEYDRDPAGGLTRGKCYYWPCSKERPVYEGVVDDDEVTSYLYPCTPESWEIVEDPTGMAARALAGDADTIDMWYPELALEEGSIYALAAEMGTTAKQTRCTSAYNEELDDGWSDSETDPVDFTCPGCGGQVHHDAWTLVNARKNPELAERLMEGTLFEFTCPRCGYTASLANPCLYLDPEHRAYVYLVADERMAEGVRAMFDNLSNGDGPTGGSGVIKRIVFDRHDLRGRVISLANGLDDRVVEILKIALRGMAKSQGVIPMDDTTSVVNLVDVDGDSLVFELEYDGEVMAAALQRGGYEMYANALSRSSAASEQAYVVDRAFAEHLIDVIKDEGLM